MCRATLGIGSDDGSEPIRAMSSDVACATIVATSTAISDDGSERRMRGNATMIAATSTTTPIAWMLPLPKDLTTALAATAAVFSPCGLVTPSAGGTC